MIVTNVDIFPIVLLCTDWNRSMAGCKRVSGENITSDTWCRRFRACKEKGVEGGSEERKLLPIAERGELADKKSPREGIGEGRRWSKESR